MTTQRVWVIATDILLATDKLYLCCENGGYHWTEDKNKMIWFCRKKDAENIKNYIFPNSNYTVVSRTVHFQAR